MFQIRLLWGAWIVREQTCNLEPTWPIGRNLGRADSSLNWRVVGKLESCAHWDAFCK